MSLVEATIILMTLAILTSVVAPSVADYINEARGVKAKEDVEALGTGLARLVRDTGYPCATTTPGATPCTVANRVELMISGSISGATASNGEIDGAVLGVTAAAGPALTAGGQSATSLNWGGSGANRPTPVQTFDQHLVTNSIGYTAVSFTGGGGPRAALGWRGGYLAGPVGLDPWGHRYEANTLFLGVASDSSVATTTNEGGKEGGWTRDAVVISAGANGLIETQFAIDGGSAGGDDVLYVIKGSTR
jgi:hypothetical protein